ncbi:MAG: hypothetical protein H7338_09420, partial [Candidatus Sericytochromatia bacterium]|nr:hypothetical protein [Candidatus Sericytochromatia bacterium]
TQLPTVGALTTASSAGAETSEGQRFIATEHTPPMSAPSQAAEVTFSPALPLQIDTTPAPPVGTNPWAAMMMAGAPPSTGPRPSKSSAKRGGGMPMLDPKAFAAMPVDTIDLPREAHGESDPAISVEAVEQITQYNVHALQQSLAALQALETQMDLLAPIPETAHFPGDAPTADSPEIPVRSMGPLPDMLVESERPEHGFDSVPVPEPTEWVDALATVKHSPEPVPAASLLEAQPTVVSLTTADDVTDFIMPEGYVIPRQLNAILEPTPAFPFPGMVPYGDDTVSHVGTAPIPILSPLAVPAAPVVAAALPAVAAIPPRDVSGDPPFYVHVAGGAVDLATAEGLAACEPELVDSMAAAGAALRTIVEQRRAQRRLHDLTERVSSGPLAIDDVIRIGREVEDARAQLAASLVDRRAVSEVVARLEQDRAVIGRLIDILWRA